VKGKQKAQRFMSTVKVGPKGQIVIPKEVRDMFGIEPGDSLVIMADSNRGIAIQHQSFLNKVADAIFAGKVAEEYPSYNSEHNEAFAENIRKLEEDQ